MNYLYDPDAGFGDEALYSAGPMLRNPKNAVEKNLDQYRLVRRVWDKYTWVATYHNYVATEFYLAKKKKHLITQEKFAPTRHRFVEVVDADAGDSD